MSRQTDDAEERVRLAASAEDLVKRANRAVRTMMLEMVHSRPLEADLADGVKWVIEDIEQLYGINVHLTDDGQAMGVHASIALVRCLRELLVNVAKHAQTNEATVTIVRVGEMVQLNVADEGAGFTVDPLVAERAGGFGLSSIRQRVVGLGGKMSIHSEPARGTKVTIEVPAR